LHPGRHHDSPLGRLPDRGGLRRSIPAFVVAITRAVLFLVPIGVVPLTHEPADNCLV
jgi:hypothetical protein